MSSFFYITFPNIDEAGFRSNRRVVRDFVAEFLDDVEECWYAGLQVCVAVCHSSVAHDRFVISHHGEAWKLVGVGCWNRTRLIPWDMPDVLADGYVAYLAVDLIWRRRGIARGILETILPLESTWALHVAAANLSAQRLYSGFGFEGSHSITGDGSMLLMVRPQN